MKRSLSLLLSIIFFFAPSLHAFGKAPAGARASGAVSVLDAVPKPSVDAGAYVLMEKDDRHVIASAFAHTRLPIASTTKIMTALVILERGDPEEPVTVSENAANTEGSSAYLRKGETVKTGDLLLFLMLQSANDAATALAEHYAGSVKAFAGWMNETAARIGMKDTHFSNPHGLEDEEHYSSAHDMALLTAYALETPGFEALVSTERCVCGKDENTRTFVNHNRLLFTLPGCIGVKTGYTLRAGRCLVSACRREDTTLICVTLSCRSDWKSHEELYAYGFSRVKRFVFEKRELEIPLISSPDASVTCTFDSYSLLFDPAGTARVRIVCPHFLFAPLKEKEVVGSAIFLLDGKEAGRADLYCVQSADEQPRAGFLSRLISAVLRLFDRE